MMIKFLTVEHREHVAQKSFEAVVAAFKTATGSVEEGFNQVTEQATNPQQFEAIFRAPEAVAGLCVSTPSIMANGYN